MRTSWSSRATRVARAALVVSLVPGPVSAQPTRALPRADVEYAEPFTTISGLRELADGRVIVADSREKTLQLIDLARGTATAVGREGAGPGEWRSLARLWALPADSTLMIDFANRRVYVAAGGTPASANRIEEGSALFWGDVVGADGQGRLLVVVSRRPTGPRGTSVGVADVIRLDRRSGRQDTLATLMQPRGEHVAVQQLDGGMLRYSTNLPLAAQDLAAMAPDGRVAIVRAAPYRVEWIAPDGRRTTGPVAAASNVRVTEEEKEAFTRSQVRPGQIIVSGPPGASAAPAGGRARGGPVPKLSSAELKRMMTPDQTWPDVKPPFLAGAVHAAPDGRVWVLRTRAHDDSIPVFDVFDQAGRVVERVALPKRTRLVGFGKAHVYLARTDDDELVWLQRVRR